MFFLLDKIYQRQTQASVTHCTRLYNWERQQPQGSWKNYTQLRNGATYSGHLGHPKHRPITILMLENGCTEEGISDPNMASCDQAMSFLSNMVYWKKGKYGTMAVACSGHSAVLAKINGQITEW